MNQKSKVFRLSSSLALARNFCFQRYIQNILSNFLATILTQALSENMQRNQSSQQTTFVGSFARLSYTYNLCNSNLQGQPPPSADGTPFVREGGILLSFRPMILFRVAKHFHTLQLGTNPVLSSKSPLRARRRYRPCPLPWKGVAQRAGGCTAMLYLIAPVELFLGTLKNLEQLLFFKLSITR